MDELDAPAGTGPILEGTIAAAAELMVEHYDWQGMVESSPDGMILADDAGTILIVNAQTEATFGYERGALLGRPVEMLLPDRFREAHTGHRAHYRNLSSPRAMGGAGLDLWGRRSDGSEFPVEVSLSPLDTPAGPRVVATIRDVSDRHEAEAHSQAVLSTIDAAHDGVFMFTADSLQFVYVNKGAELQLGYDRGELLAMSPLHIKPEFTEASFRQLIEPMVAGAVESVTFTTVHRRKGGEEVPVEILLEYPPAAGPTHPRYLVALVRDITDRLITEEALRAKAAAHKLLEERERLARDLHDVVIQRLFAAGMGLQAVRSLVTDSTASAKLAATVEELDETITELRSAIFHLTAQEDESLAVQIEEVVTHATPALGFSPSVVLDRDADRIPGAVVEQMLPVLTEGLANVARHAAATAVEIHLTVSVTSCCLLITDNGVGLDPDAVAGHGLANIESRAARVKGASELTAAPDGGTRLSWSAAI